MNSDPDPQPAIVRLAATVILVRDEPEFQVLMMRRNNRGQFASALVFPGGVIEDDDAHDDWLPHLSGHEDLTIDERAIRIGAARETLEEAGILLSQHRTIINQKPSVIDPTAELKGLLKRNNHHLPLAQFHRFAHWVTPLGAPKRFDTHFYITKAPEGQIAKQDGQETIDLEWTSPQALVARAEAGEGGLIFATIANLRLLAKANNSDEAIAATRTRKIVKVTPTVVREGNKTKITLPSAAGYGDFHEIISH